MTTRVLIAICLAIAAPAYAQQSDALKKAQAAFDQAQVDYLAGKYDDAAKGFQEAYASRPFPQFLYNVGASFHMKGKKASDPEAYAQAVDFYKKYLSEEPQASDRPKVEKAISVLEAEIQRLKAAPTPGAGSAAVTTDRPPSQEVQQLGDVKVRGLVVIDSEPQGATIYIDDKKKGPFATTPWSGSLDGDHRVIIEKRGYKEATSTISADPSKLFVLKLVISQADYLGWVEVTSNVPGADVYMDDKSVGPVGKTPLSQNVKPGKHTFWISTEGYNEYSETVDIAAGETATVKGNLNGNPVGKLSVVGFGIEDSTTRIDGAVACERGACLKSLQQGDHTIEVSRSGYKTYKTRVNIAARTETTIKVSLAKKPGHGDAIVAYVFAAGFAAGGVFLGKKSQSLHDDIAHDQMLGMPPPDDNDPRILRGKIYAISADAAYGIAAISAITAIYYTFRSKGPSSTGFVDMRALTLRPEVGPTYAGVGMEVSW